MKVIKRLLGWSIVCIVILISGYRYLTPSITVENRSNVDIISSRVELPSSGLDFGKVAAGEKNAIYYDLNQNDGTISYHFLLSDDTEIIGKCGYVTRNQINHRTVIYIETSKQATCLLEE
ncbi:hypothetical protein [Shewanella aestuarii]|uniref:Uncharacterized protein n=1 Tax=Shewanella aestuarii TaxID=1028752 RepID=A0A6G9QLQ9_9GAMM|nr:hypothetical protein [Shewanella aestuarii]QIR15412.1 hypothetical protein HBH39_13655 [Shewanella aestuarii]